MDRLFKITKKGLALLLSTIMLLGVFPLSALADEIGEPSPATEQPAAVQTEQNTAAQEEQNNETAPAAKESDVVMPEAEQEQSAPSEETNKPEEAVTTEETQEPEETATTEEAQNTEAESSETPAAADPAETPAANAPAETTETADAEPEADPLPPADAEIKVGQAAEYAFTTNKRAYTIRLTVLYPCKLRLTYSYAGAITISMRNEQDGSEKLFDGENVEDSAWKTLEASLVAAAGTYFITVTAAKELQPEDVYSFIVQFDYDVEKPSEQEQDEEAVTEPEKMEEPASEPEKVEEDATEPEQTEEPVSEPEKAEEQPDEGSENAISSEQAPTANAPVVTADYVFLQATAYLKDILAATGRTADNNSTLEVDSAAITLSSETVKNNNRNSITLTANDYFDLATLTITKNKNNVQRITLSYPAPVQPTEPEQAASYTFTSEDDYIMLLSLLTEAGIYTTAIEDVTADSDSVELYDYIGDYMVVPAAHFAEILLTVTTREGEVYTVALYYPEPEEEPVVLIDYTESDPLKPQAPADAIWANDVLYLTGKMPSGAVVDCMPVEVEIDGEYVVAAYDIKIYANENQKQKGHQWQPNGDKVRVHFFAAEADEAMHVYHSDDGQAPELIGTVVPEDGWVTFEAEHFSTYALSFFEDLWNHTVGAALNKLLYKNTVFENDEIILTGNLPRNAIIEANKVDASVEGQDVIVAYDIKIYQNSFFKLLGVTWQPKEGTVQVRMKSDALTTANVDIYHKASENAAAELVSGNATVRDNSVTFDASSFSVYIVTENVYLRTYQFFTINEYGDYTQYPFYTETGGTVFSQTIRNGETPIVPSNPTNPLEPEATFAGWYEGEEDATSHTLRFAEKPYDFNHIPEITEKSETVRLYARFTSYTYVIFHDQYDAASDSFPVAYTVRVETENGSGTLDTSPYRVVYSGGKSMTFYGWSYTSIKEPGSQYDDSYHTVTKIQDTITVTGTTELYPIFKSIYWITFYSGVSGSGATYYPDTYYFDGEGPDSLAAYIPTRNDGDNGAYTFAGWYAGATLDDKGEVNIENAVRIADADGVLIPNAQATGIVVADDHIKLESNVTLYAAWTTANTADYTIIVWKQSASDAESLADSEKSWVYAEVFILNGTVGEAVSVGENYKNLHTAAGYNAVHETNIADGEPTPYDGFTFNSGKSNTDGMVKADGSLVFNLYYDRSNFNPPTGSYVLTFADSVMDGERKSPNLPVSYDQNSGENAKIPYGTELSSYAEAVDEPVSGIKKGFRFTFWYADPACTIPVFFKAPTQQELLNAGILKENQSEYEPTGRQYVVYETMPDQNVTVYAGWKEIKYRVNIDPNYGAMYTREDDQFVGTGATYFNGTYTSVIQEYTTVTRDYVESVSGEWYYVKHDRAFYEAGNKTQDNDRYTYYTQDPSEATEYTTFAHEPGIYRYAGWYEVLFDEFGNEIGEEPYVFGTPVDHDTYLRLHWTKVGAFYLVYDAGEGKLTGGEDLEPVYVTLDQDSYMDNAQVVVTRSAEAPEGYEFAGWTIHNDDSNTVYYPGSVFTLLTQYASTVQGKKTVYLDAVYTRLPTAKIVYHANGGNMNTDTIDYGSVGTGLPTPVTAYDKANGTVTVSNLVNNGQVILSDGSRYLSMPGATFIGWCANPTYDPNNEEAPLLYAGAEQTYNVSAYGSVDLYAVWQVSVNYHLNHSSASWGSEEWDSETYTLTEKNGELYYTQNVYLGQPVDKPEHVPEFQNGARIFRYWATKGNGNHEPEYDFTQPVTGALDLYAYWSEPIQVKIHAVDASVKALAEKSVWVNDSNSTLSVSTTEIALDAETARGRITPPSDYEFAFAAVLDKTANQNNLSISEENKADAVYYDSVSGHVTAKTGEDTFTFADNDEIYFVFYQKRALDIAYKSMAEDGTLTDAAVEGSAPTTTGTSLLGSYDMAASMTAPLSWQSGSSYSYYAFAIGEKNATSTSALQLLTEASGSSDAPSALTVRNTWREFQYSTDGGTTWQNCGYDPQLYVIYYPKQPIVVTFREETVGLSSDMDKDFTFHYKIENSLDNGNTWTSVYDTTTGADAAISLHDGESYSAVLFVSDTERQKITVTQTADSEFSTKIGDEETLNYTYTANSEDKTHTVTFTNRRKSIPVEVHVALVDVNSGTITQSDNLRAQDAEKYSFDLQMGESKVFADTLSPSELFTGDADDYAFGAVLYGTDNGDNTAITPEAMGIASIAFAQVGDTNEYRVNLQDNTGFEIGEQEEFHIYYLYYLMPQIRYVEEKAGGELKPIKGANSEGVETDDPSYNMASLWLNGVKVTQDQKFEIPAEGRTIAQTVGRFRMPPLLDSGEQALYLLYSKIGAGVENATTTGAIETSEALTLHIRFADNKLQWSFDGQEWKSFTGSPTVYAIYRERGYDLTITKKVPIDTGFTEPFTITVSSDAINRSSYDVEGLGSSSVEATPHTEGKPGTIRLTVTDGSEIKLIGMGAGEYTITESGHDNFALTVQVKVGSDDAFAASVEDNDHLTVMVNAEARVELTNTPNYICQVGTTKFYTLSSAVKYIGDNHSDLTGTIEMLTDYVMPVSDTLQIPDYMDVTLTTAETLGHPAVITRRSTFTTGAMGTNAGTLTLQNIVLDGNHVNASCALLENEGELTISSGAVLRNSDNHVYGGAVNSWEGTVTVADGANITANKAALGGAIYLSGGEAVVSGGLIHGNSAENGGAVYAASGTVTVSGGEIKGNNAENGGAIYMNTGTLYVSGGSIDQNTATGNGGAVYAANASAEISGGTIGGTGNTATNGGAVYLEAGAVTLSGAADLSGNTANANGGAIYANTGTVAATGGTVTGNHATGNGGGLWIGSGSATLTGGSFTNNTATNGAAIYANTGSANMTAITITSNTATAGGAVGVGSATAKLYFSGNVKVTDNTMNGAASNVYLDQDTDTVINAATLGNNASIGIYVPDTSVEGTTETLFDRHGVPSTFFATYDKDNNVTKFTNDRLPGLSVQKETTSKRLYWGKAFAVEVRYLASLSGCIPTMADGTLKQVDNKTTINYYAPASANPASGIADDLRENHTIKDLNTSAVFAAAFVGNDRTFANYITDVNWDSTNNRWSFVKRDGTAIEGNKLVVYFAEPAYVSIENNTGYTLTINQMTVTFGTAQNVINNSEQAGYGYVFAQNGAVRSDLQPVTAADMTLEPGKSIRILLPGGRNVNYSLNGSFANPAEDISYTLTGVQNPSTLSQERADNFEVSGKTLNNSGLYEIIFGGKSSICRIVTAAIDGVQNDEIAAKTTEPDAEGKIEYTFSTLRQAVNFIKNHSLNTAAIEMLKDYILPGTDVVEDLPEGYDITFSTAVTGTYKYSDDPDARATISRADGNSNSFIRAQNGSLNSESTTYEGKLTVKNLIFDGKAFGGNSIQGGIIRTKGRNVEIDNVDFRNCRAQYGGGIFIESVWPKTGEQTPYGYLIVSNSNFINCQSLKGEDKFGGGGVWTSMREMTLSNCTFNSCESAAVIGNANAQGGGVFHYVGNINANIATKSTVTNCIFDNCSANAGGSMECGAKYVTVEKCTFRNSTAKTKNGGALNVWVYDSDSSINDSWAVLKDSVFENCYCVKISDSSGNGGAMRSTAVYNTIVNCVFTNIKGAKGGAINITNKNAKDTIVSNCVFNECTAALEGGAIYCVSKTLTVGNYTDENGESKTGSDTFRNCIATKEGGGIYHSNNNAPDSFYMENVTIESCKSEAKDGGGLYTKAQTATVKNSRIANCVAIGSGGGIYHAGSGSLILDASVVTGNTAGKVEDNDSNGQGGGVYAANHLVLRNGVSVTGNRLATNVSANAAGVYMNNKKMLTIGAEGATDPEASTIKDNYTANGAASNLRLPMKDRDTENANSVSVLCGLSGEIRVVNAIKKGTQFGLSSIAYPYGVSDLFHVFKADDDSLYGIINRQDETGTMIIWAADPICKITDDKGHMLYLDQEHTYPAVFDVLDDGTADAKKTSPFGILRMTNPALYTSGGAQYTENTYQVKMLVEEYTATKKLTTPTNTNRTIVFTTAGNTDSLYPYRGKTGTRATITANVGNEALLTVKSNMQLTNIVLDGGSENGVTPKDKTRIINASNGGTVDSNKIQLTLGRNAALQNAATTGNGGGVLLNNGASLSVEGGTIRNCKATNGGGIYKDGSQGTLTMTGGTITGCEATADGGGVYVLKNTFTMTGGSIIRCSAVNGGGVYLSNNTPKFIMVGGSITANQATTKGGGIAVGGNKARLEFSGAPQVIRNTCNEAANNIQMDQSFTYNSDEGQADNPTTLIKVTDSGLTHGAAIGVYVPDSNNLYNNHGVQSKPFATYANSANTGTLYFFVNDRNGLKGGLMENQNEQNYKIYWRDIYSLEVHKTVLSDDPRDSNTEFPFVVQLRGKAVLNGAEIQAESFSGTYGEMEFTNGVARFKLKDGETKTAIKLPFGFGYEITEELSESAQTYYKTTPSRKQEGAMETETKYVYSVSFTNLHAVCKITDTQYGLLYYFDNGVYRPAVYSLLTTAFNHLKSQDFFYLENGTYQRCNTVNTGNTQVEMLIDDYVLEGTTTFQSGTRATLTTADPNATDGFPYAGNGTAVITRGYTGQSMITVQGDLTLGNITLDGGGNSYTANTDGGVFMVASRGMLTAGTGATIRNSRTTAKGAGVYLAEGGKLKLSGNPIFMDNTSSAVSLGEDAKNGGEAYTTAKQDIYIAGYSDKEADSLAITGNLTGAQGSIWVWAEQLPHYQQNQQFAVLEGGSYTGLNVFRNARTDADSDNQLNTTPKYLYGISRGDGKVYWSGGVKLTITKTVTGTFGDLTKDFTFTMRSIEGDTGSAYTYEKRATNGAVTNGTLHVNSTFTLRHGESIEIVLPKDKNVTISEANENYTTTWKLNDEKATTGSGTTVTLTADATLAVTNHLNAIGPTNVSLATRPFLWMLLFGLALLTGVAGPVYIKKRKENNA